LNIFNVVGITIISIFPMSSELWMSDSECKSQFYAPLWTVTD